MPRPQRFSRRMRLAELIAHYREKAGLKQSDVAEKLARHQPLVSAIEAGQRRVDLIEFLDLAEAIGIDPCEIVKALLEVPKD